jgi:hypothetical protein
MDSWRGNVGVKLGRPHDHRMLAPIVRLFSPKYAALRPSSATSCDITARFVLASRNLEGRMRTPLAQPSYHNRVVVETVLLCSHPWCELRQEALAR